MYTTLLILPALLSTPGPAATPPGTVDPSTRPESSLLAEWYSSPASSYEYDTADFGGAAIASPFDPYHRDDAHPDHLHHSTHPWYLRANFGLVTTTDSDGPGEEIDFDEGWLAALGIGRRMTDGAGAVNFGLELEGVWTQQDADTNPALDDITTLSAYLNGVFDFRLSDRFSLYAGAGIGASWMDVGTMSDAVNDFDDEDGPFLSWQLKAGLMWRLSSNTGLTFGYRFINIDDNEIDNDADDSSFDLETEQHVLELGLLFGF